MTLRTPPPSSPADPHHRPTAALRVRLVATFAAAACAVSLVASLPASADAGSSATTASACAPVDSALTAGSTSGPRAVVVSGRQGADDAVRVAVQRAGGRELRALPIVDGIAATVDVAALGRLSCATGVRAVSANAAIHLQSLNDQADGAGADATDSTDAPTVSHFLHATGADNLRRIGLNGRGIGVAVIDTGVSPMPDVAGRVVYGPDLSGEGTYLDSFGHGTVMASLIGGNGTASGREYTGVAPGARLVSVKVAGRNGAVDVSTILQAMHWVASYRQQYNIRVLNLSWGTPSTQSPSVDPLDYAVERLWGLGIVVVAAAGNDGPNAGTILKPGDDPMVITAGAYEEGSTRYQGDDSVPSWSAVGPTAAGDAKPDLVAPGRSLVAERAYGSSVEADNPQALIAPSYIKGSGTSEATAVTSGAVALLLQARPNLTPDQVKSILVRMARPIRNVPATAQGAGRLKIDAAVFAAARARVQQTGTATGLGSIEASRGGHHVIVDCGEDGTPDVIAGEIDVRCEPWDGASWTGASWTGASWTGASWTGASWTGASWTGASWTGASWTGASWTGTAWTGASWTGSAWTGASWTGASWTGASWTGASWTDEEWTQSSGKPTQFQTAWWGDFPPATSPFVAD